MCVFNGLWLDFLKKITLYCSLCYLLFLANVCYRYQSKRLFLSLPPCLPPHPSVCLPAVQCLPNHLGSRQRPCWYSATFTAKWCQGQLLRQGRSTGSSRFSSCCVHSVCLTYKDFYMILWGCTDVSYVCIY